MKNSRNIVLFLALTIGQFCSAIDPYDQYSRYNNNSYDFNQSNAGPRSSQYMNIINGDYNRSQVQNSEIKTNDLTQVQNSEITADNLTKESYITSEMLEALIFGLDNQSDVITIDKTTGAVTNLPSVSTILENLPTNETSKNTLHAMLEATEIALFVAELNTKYDGLNFNPADGLIDNLQQQKKDIQERLNLINKQGSYYSWIFGSIANDKTPFNSSVDNKKIPVDQNSPTINLPVSYIKSIANHNSYKQQPHAAQAANLLFQQCFIAQQHRFPNPIALMINPEKFTPKNYIYTSFPKISHFGKYPICDDILKLNPADRRTRLLQIRQAVQTALYIANKKSAVNIGYLLPQSVVSYLDGIVAELMRYDAYVNNLCKDARYGATADDMTKLEAWSTMSKVAAGIAIVGGAIAAVHMYDKTALPTAYNKTSEVIGSGYNQVQQKASDLNTWFNTPAPASAPQKVENKSENAPAGFLSTLKKDVNTLIGTITPEKKPEQSWLDTRIANAQKVFDRGIDHKQLDADEKETESRAKNVRFYLKDPNQSPDAINKSYQDAATSAAKYASEQASLTKELELQARPILRKEAKDPDKITHSDDAILEKYKQQKLISDAAQKTADDKKQNALVANLETPKYKNELVAQEKANKKAEEEAKKQKLAALQPSWSEKFTDFKDTLTDKIESIPQHIKDTLNSSDTQYNEAVKNYGPQQQAEWNNSLVGKTLNYINQSAKSAPASNQNSVSDQELAYYMDSAV